MKKFIPFLLCCSAIALCAIAFSQTSYAQPPDLKFTSFTANDFRSMSSTVSRTGYIARGKRPNAGNVRDSVFMNHGFSWESPVDGGFLRVGHRFTDSSRYYGWFFYLRWNYSPAEVRYYIFSRSALRKSPNYLPWHGEMKTTPYFGNGSNSLTQNITALKTNIAASDLGLTPPGFGDLVFNQASGSETILNGKTLRDIVRLADSAMTLGKRRQSQYPLSLLAILNTVASRVNSEFLPSVVETTSTNPLVIKGAKSVLSVSYLMYDSTRLMPWNRNRTEVRRMTRETALTITGYALNQNYPNPFNPTTTISFELPTESNVKLTIYDAAGREVTTLVNEQLGSGAQMVEWNAASVASGVYFYRMEATSLTQPGVSFVQHRKMLLLK